mgnify:CR=1 FL=1
MDYNPSIFKAYDIRGLVGIDYDDEFCEALGRAFVLHTGAKTIVAGRDMRGSSPGYFAALTRGIMKQGADVIDIGMVDTSMVYFAINHLDCAGGVMVTASHNENGWTGVKMGANRPLTFGPDEMTRLKDIVLNAKFKTREGGVIKLFEGSHGYGDGEQRRDFIYVGDVVRANLWAWEKGITGLFNLGVGSSRSFNDMAAATFASLGRPSRVHYVDMPDGLVHKYQYFTEAKRANATVGTPITLITSGVSGSSVVVEVPKVAWLVV